MNVCTFCADDNFAKLLGLRVKVRIEISDFILELAVQRSDVGPDFLSYLLGACDISRFFTCASSRLDSGRSSWGREVY